MIATKMSHSIPTNPVLRVVFGRMSACTKHMSVGTFSEVGRDHNLDAFACIVNIDGALEFSLDEHGNEP
jgi:hypothetical protein